LYFTTSPSQCNPLPKKVTISPSQADKLFDLAGEQIFRGNYTEAVATYERLLNYLPQHAPLRADVLAQLGVAHGMLQNYPQSYEAFTEALALQPNNAELWINRSMACRFTIRFGRALRDIEQAIKLNTRPEMAEKLNDGLSINRKLAEMSMKWQGPNVTLDQLIEQEDLFHQGLKLMEASKWAEAGQAFEASIALGDGLPQPWGNLGICLIMQERYDEAETALKHTLVIDPEYTIAKNNLASLPETRRLGPPEIVKLNQPFKDSKMKQSINFIRE